MSQACPELDPIGAVALNCSVGGNTHLVEANHQCGQSHLDAKQPLQTSSRLFRYPGLFTQSTDRRVHWHQHGTRAINEARDVGRSHRAVIHNDLIST